MAYRYRLTPSFNDGMNDAPPFEITINNRLYLIESIIDEITNDDGELFGPGFTLLIERLED